MPQTQQDKIQRSIKTKVILLNTAKSTFQIVRIIALKDGGHLHSPWEVVRRFYNQCMGCTVLLFEILFLVYQILCTHRLIFRVLSHNNMNQSKKLTKSANQLRTQKTNSRSKCGKAIRFDLIPTHTELQKGLQRVCQFLIGYTFFIIRWLP